MEPYKMFYFMKPCCLRNASFVGSLPRKAFFIEKVWKTKKICKFAKNNIKNNDIEIKENIG